MKRQLPIPLPENKNPRFFPAFLNIIESLSGSFFTSFRNSSYQVIKSNLSHPTTKYLVNKLFDNHFAFYLPSTYEVLQGGTANDFATSRYRFRYRVYGLV